MQKTCTFKNFSACFFCNHYTAKGQEKDSAFSEPKPQLLLTKPKLNVPKPDKNLPIGKSPLCGLAFRRPRRGRIRSQLSRIRGSNSFYSQFPYARKISRKSKKKKPSPNPSDRNEGGGFTVFCDIFPSLTGER